MRTTWILIANASEARIFQSQTPKEIKLIRQLKHPESREKVINLVSSLAGRYRRPAATATGLYQELTSPKEVEAERFAHELALHLNEGRNQHEYKKLVVIAPAHFQGLLNKVCNSHVKNLIAQTLDKDYTKIKQHDLLHYLDGKVSLKKAA